MTTVPKRTSSVQHALYTTTVLLAFATTEATSQNRKPLAEGTPIRVSHLCTPAADSTRLCSAFRQSPIIGVFGGISADDQLRLIAPDSAASALIPVQSLITVQERRASTAGGVGGGVIGLVVGTGIAVFLISTVVPGEDLEGGGSATAKLSLFLPIIGGAVAGAFAGGGRRWRGVPMQRLQSIDAQDPLRAPGPERRGQRRSR